MRNDDTQRRVVEALRHAMGATIRAGLDDPDVIEVMVNPDGRIWFDRIGQGREPTDQVLSPADAESILRLLADHAGVVVTDERPLVSASLPLTGERFQGIFPPITATPSFAIRKPARAVFRLDDYVRRGQLTPGEATTLRRAIADRLNILIIGGTSSGKTTFANALLAEPAFSEDRVVIIEQTQELQCSAPDCLPMLTREIEPRVTTRDLVVASLRLRPDRIVIGEVRDGAALEMIKAWNTGHPGGLGTLHANSPIDALYRIEDLIGEVSERVPYRAIASSINMIVEIKRTPEGRRVTGIMRVAGWQDGRYLFADDSRIDR